MTSQSTPVIDHVSAKLIFEKFDFEDSVFKKLGEDLCREIGFNVVKIVDHHFEPIGYTIVFILAESHLAIHTWPEYNLIHIDLLSCKKINIEIFNSTVKKLLVEFNIINFESSLHKI